MKRKYLILFSLSGLIISLDQLLKHWFYVTLPEGVEHRLIPNLVSLTHRHSVGFAFGLLRSPPERFRELFLLGVPAFALILVVLIFIKLRDNQTTTSLALTSIFSGAIGNLIDRVQHGFVIDFLDIKLGDRLLLPALNIADFAIIMGVAILLLSTVRHEVRGQSRE